MILCISSLKGGVGKTTLAAHIAVSAQRAGKGPVVLLDLDPQGSLSAWWTERQAEDVALANLAGKNIGITCREMKAAGARLIIIDTPPATGSVVSDAIAAADLVLVPTRPSPHDLRAVGSTLDLIESHSKRAVFVVNAATARARITAEAAIALSQHGTVAPIQVHNRVDLASTMTDGRTVIECDPAGKSAGEIERLTQYVLTQLRKSVRA